MLIALYPERVSGKKGRSTDADLSARRAKVEADAAAVKAHATAANLACSERETRDTGAGTKGTDTEADRRCEAGEAEE